MDAQGAVDSLLGRLTTVLVNEVQLLGGVRGDVEFIKDEMECMNSLIVDLTEAQHRNNQVRTWMKQVVGLTRDCGGNVELYVHYIGGGSGGGVGLLGFLRRIPRFVRTVSVRHQIASRIRELKVRAREVGDRRLRYGVTVPPTEPAKDHHIAVVVRPAPLPGSPEEEDEFQRRELLDAPVFDFQAITDLVQRLLRPDKGAAERVFAITEQDGRRLPPGVARRIYEHSSVVSSFQDRRAWLEFATLGSRKDLDEICRKLLEQLPVPPDMLTRHDGRSLGWSEFKEYLEQGEKFLIVFDNVTTEDDEFISHLKKSHGNPSNNANKLVMTAERGNKLEVLLDRSYYLGRDDILHSSVHRIEYLAQCNVPSASKVIENCSTDTFALQMFFRLIYVTPNWAYSEMKRLCKELANSSSNTGQIMLRFCYKDLPSNHKSCLLYLSFFPQGHIIRRTSLLRRWLAEGMVSERSTLRLKDKGRQGIGTVDDEAECIFDALVARGFLHPEETSAAGKIKTFTVPVIIHNFIVRDLSYMDTSMPPDLAHRLSINNGVQLQEAPCSDGPFDEVLALLKQITASFQWQMLKVLDLEGCTGLTRKHLENVCQILLLKYLSLRATDIKELPKQIEKLQCLETLDIRQTMVQAFSKRRIKLPMLKYFLARNRESSSNSFSKFKGPFTTVSLPKGIRRMKNLQVLSYVDVSNNKDDLNDIGQLLQLRKLGVILHGDKDV